MRQMSFAILTAMLVAGTAGAETRSVSVTGADFIVSPAGEGRILLKFPTLGRLQDVAIAEARLKIPVLAVAPQEGLEIRVHPILRDWTPGAVDWTAGWSRPGGDFDTAVYGKSEFRNSGRLTTSDIDVTVIVLEMQDGLNSYGLLVTVPSYRGEGFDSTNRDRLVQALQGATLEIRYRNRVVPPRLRRG